jgi:hypothetical protein
LTYLELTLDQKSNREDPWWKLWEQLAAMERLDHLKLERPQASYDWQYYDHNDRSGFVDREEIRAGLARLLDAETIRK